MIADTRPSPWTEAKVELLRSMHTDGKSAAEISMMLGDGITRNAVIGKIHRLKMPAYGHRPHPRQPPAPRHRMAVRPRVRAASPGKPKPVIIPVVPLPRRDAWLPLPGTTPTTVENHKGDGHCRWPVGDEPVLFCGEPTGGREHVYCPQHTTLTVGRIWDSGENPAE